jgi:hypothetical protein
VPWSFAQARISPLRYVRTVIHAFNESEFAALDPMERGQALNDQ